MLVRTIAFLSICLLPLSAGEEKVSRRLQAAANVFHEIMVAPDQAIPQDLLNRAQCVIIVPGAKKGAFLFGGRYGRGFAVCRKAEGVGWGAPGAMRIEGFNFGLQAGGVETDLIMVVMNERGFRRLLTSRFTLGGDATGAAGPVGRTITAQTDALLTAEILSYSRSRGAFAGVSLDGATLRQDPGVNRALYGTEHDYSNRQVLTGDFPVPPDATELIALLNRHSARKGR